MLDAPDPAHGDVLLEAFARSELNLSHTEIRWCMTDAELGLHVKAWEYETRRTRYREQYARKYREWEVQQKRKR